MEGYSEPGAVYFSIGKQTAFAKINLNNSQIITGSYFGAPPYKKIQGKLSNLAKEFHAAEHQVYNCFRKKIQKLKSNASLRLLKRFIPRIEEVADTKPFALNCGTTVFLSSGMLLILASLPNLFSFYNTNFLFMTLWILGSIAVTAIVSAKVQTKYFLTKPKPYQLEIALEALKEALNNGHNTNEFTCSTRFLNQGPNFRLCNDLTNLGLQSHRESN